MFLGADFPIIEHSLKFYLTAEFNYSSLILITTIVIININFSIKSYFRAKSSRRTYFLHYFFRMKKLSSSKLILHNCRQRKAAVFFLEIPRNPFQVPKIPAVDFSS